MEQCIDQTKHVCGPYLALGIRFVIFDSFIRLFSCLLLVLPARLCTQCALGNVFVLLITASSVPNMYLAHNVNSVNIYFMNGCTYLNFLCILFNHALWMNEWIKIKFSIKLFEKNNTIKSDNRWSQSYMKIY